MAAKTNRSKKSLMGDWTTSRSNNRNKRVTELAPLGGWCRAIAGSEAVGMCSLTACSTKLSSRRERKFGDEDTRKRDTVTSED